MRCARIPSWRLRRCNRRRRRRRRPWRRRRRLASGTRRLARWGRSWTRAHQTGSTRPRRPSNDLVSSGGVDDGRDRTDAEPTPTTRPRPPPRRRARPEPVFVPRNPPPPLRSSALTSAAAGLLQATCTSHPPELFFGGHVHRASPSHRPPVLPSAVCPGPSPLGQTAPAAAAAAYGSTTRYPVPEVWSTPKGGRGGTHTHTDVVSSRTVFAPLPTVPADRSVNGNGFITLPVYPPPAGTPGSGDSAKPALRKSSSNVQWRGQTVVRAKSGRPGRFAPLSVRRHRVILSKRRKPPSPRIHVYAAKDPRTGPGSGEG